ncbi:serine/threonine-protein phosphatase 4 regulatory subunit 4-like [Tachypleus tridentatus]|uniref:serine/threonine-protein phosphatase 4 regulatory subunit 4-like n=1 Tax=Tachypleus tridentatus TaxID=6853 RepID=UPI003FD29DA3
MWLGENERCSPPCSTNTETQGLKPPFIEGNTRCNSPPLEGGESLCDFYPLSCPDQVEQRLKNLEVKEIDEIHNNPNAQAEVVLSPPHEDRLGDGTPFLSLFSQEFVPSNTFTQTFLQGILSFVESRDPVVASAWMETLLDVIDLLPKEIIKRDLLTLAVNKGQLSQPVSSRLLCCKMVGKISTKFDPYIIRKEILPVVQSLCQDVDFEVRGCMCRQLDAVARGIGLEATKSALLPELVELANDEESYVRLAGIETVVRMLPMLDDETCIHTVVPLVKKCCENFMKMEDSTLPVVAKELGKLCCGLSVNLSEEQRTWFLMYYRKLAVLGLPAVRSSNEASNKKSCKLLKIIMPDVVPQSDNQDTDRYMECRLACAYNFPAMVLFAEPVNFYRELYNTFQSLTTDPSSSVRRTVACGIHEVTKMLGTKACFIQTELIQLLTDDTLEVIKGLVVHLPETLEVITASNELRDEKEKESLENLIEALLMCEDTASQTSNWRLHADFLSRLVCVVQCFPGRHLYDTFVPLLLNRLHTARPIPCRLAAAYTLLVMVRNIPLLDRRLSVIDRLTADLCHGRSCRSRMLYISVCQLVMDLFSKTFFKQYFFRPLLGLACDPVPNIRLRLCSVFPQLKSLIMLPVDGPLLQELESCVSRLMTSEKDRDVMAAVGLAIEELDKIEVSMEPGSQRSSFAEPEVDFEDLRKEEEERKLLELEDKHRKEYSFSSKSCPGSLTRKGKIPVRKEKPISRISGVQDESESQQPRVYRSLSPPRTVASVPSSLVTTRVKRSPAGRSLIQQRRKSSGFEVSNLVSRRSEKEANLKSSLSKGLSSPANSFDGRKKAGPQVHPDPRTPIPSRKAVALTNTRSQAGTRIPTPHLGLVKTAAGDRCPSPLPSPTGQPITLDQLLPSLTGHSTNLDKQLPSPNARPTNLDKLLPPSLPAPTSQPETMEKMLLSPLEATHQSETWDKLCPLSQPTEFLPPPVLTKSTSCYSVVGGTSIANHRRKPSSESVNGKNNIMCLSKSHSSDNVTTRSNLDKNFSSRLPGAVPSKHQSNNKNVSTKHPQGETPASCLEPSKRPVTPNPNLATLQSSSKIPTPKSTVKRKSFTGYS